MIRRLAVLVMLLGLVTTPVAAQPTQLGRQQPLRVSKETLEERGMTDIEVSVVPGVEWPGATTAGHEVTVATAPSFEAFVSDHGLAFAPVRADYCELLDSPEAQAALRNPLKMRSMINETTKPLMTRMLEDQATTAEGADLIVFHPKAMGATHIGEARAVPAMAGLPVPALIPTSEFPLPGFSFSLPAALNRLSYRLLDLSTAPFSKIITRWRAAALGLPPRAKGVGNFKLADGSWPPTMLAVSPSVLPTPRDWPADSSVPGYWFSDPDPAWAPPAELVSFLDDGPAPVAVGFGSMVVKDPERTASEILAGIRASGRRIVLVTGRSEFNADPAEDLYQVETVPNHWLYPQMAAVIHHGGAGTTAAGLRAGIPTIVTPLMGDQSFWGRRVAAIGAGPAPLPMKKISAAAIESAVRAATEDVLIAGRASAIGEAIRAEDGIGAAVATIESVQERYLAF